MYQGFEAGFRMMFLRGFLTVTNLYPIAPKSDYFLGGGKDKKKSPSNR
jgi:hypothetical protein